MGVGGGRVQGGALDGAWISCGGGGGSTGRDPRALFVGLPEPTHVL